MHRSPSDVRPLRPGGFGIGNEDAEGNRRHETGSALNEALSLIKMISKRHAIAILVYLVVASLVIFCLYLFLPLKYEATSVISLSYNRPYNIDEDKIIGPSVPGSLAQKAVALLTSEDVIWMAIKSVGFDAMRPDPSASKQATIARTKKALNVRQVGLSEIVQVNFIDRNPQLAAEFTNKLVDIFAHAYAGLYSNASAEFLFTERRKKNRLALEAAALNLQKFASTNRAFKIDVQIRLLVEERSQLISDRTKTGSLIEEKAAKIATIPDLLSQLKPFSQLPRVSKFVSNSKMPKARDSEKSLPIGAAASDPPLLLVKVYQDTIANLVNLRTELAGLRALEADQRSTIEHLDEKLNSLGSKQAEYGRLSREVADKRALDEIFSKKIAELQVSRELNEHLLSDVNVVQAASLKLKNSVVDTAFWYFYFHPADSSLSDLLGVHEPFSVRAISATQTLFSS